MDMSGQLHSLAALLLGKEPSEPIGQEWAQYWSGCGGREKKIPSLPLPGIIFLSSSM
jgi:hypothetical protein